MHSLTTTGGALALYAALLAIGCSSHQALPPGDDGGRLHPDAAVGDAGTRDSQTTDGQVNGDGSQDRPVPAWPDTTRGVHRNSFIMGHYPAGTRKNDDKFLCLLNRDQTQLPDDELDRMTALIDVSASTLRETVGRLVGRIKGPQLHYSQVNSASGPLFTMWPPGDLDSGWSDVNQYEGAFLHAADPAAVIAEPVESGVLLTWKPDDRDGIFSIDGYYVERAWSVSGPFERLTGDPIPHHGTTRLSHRDAIPRGQRAYYRILSTAKDITVGTLEYSQVIEGQAGPRSGTILTEPLLQLSGPLLAGTTVTATFSVQVKGPRPSVVVVWYDKHIEQGVFHEHARTHESAALELAPVGNGIYRGQQEITVHDGVWQTPRALAYGFWALSDGELLASLPGLSDSYTTARNNRIYDGYWEDEDVLDPRSAHAREFIIRRFSKEQSWGFDGELWDGFALFNEGSQFHYVSALPQGARQDRRAFAKAYDAGLLQMAAEAKEALGERYLVVADQFEHSFDLSRVAGFIDGLASEFSGTLEQADRWPADVTRALQVQRFGMAWLGGGGSPPPEGKSPLDPERRLFSLASYLMSNAGRSYHNYLAPAEIRDGMVKCGPRDLPEMHLDLGDPRNPRPSSVQAYERHDARGRLFYRRDYSHGTVFVTAGTEGATITPPPNSHRVALKDLEMSTEPALTTIDMAPVEGIIVLDHELP